MARLWLRPPCGATRGCSSPRRGPSSWRTTRSTAWATRSVSDRTTRRRGARRWRSAETWSCVPPRPVTSSFGSSARGRTRPLGTLLRSATAGPGRGTGGRTGRPRARGPRTPRGSRPGRATASRSGSTCGPSIRSRRTSSAASEARRRGASAARSGRGARRTRGAPSCRGPGGPQRSRVVTRKVIG